MGQPCNNRKRCLIRWLRPCTKLVIACACSEIAHAHMLTVRAGEAGKLLVLSDLGQLRRRWRVFGAVLGARAGSAHCGPDFRAVRTSIVLQSPAAADKHHAIRPAKGARKDRGRSGSGHWRMCCGNVGIPGGLGDSKVDSAPSRWD